MFKCLPSSPETPERREKPWKTKKKQIKKKIKLVTKIYYEKGQDFLIYLV